MYKRLITTHLAIFSVLCFVLISSAERGFADQTAQGEAKYTLQDVMTETGGDSLTVRLSGNTHPAYTSRELFDPYRLIIDLAEVTVADTLDLNDLLPTNKIAELKTTVVKGLKPEITRFIFTISDGYKQNVDREGNDIVVTITPSLASTVAKAGETATTENTEPTEANSKIRELIESSVKVSEGGEGGDGSLSDLEENFSISGYKREKISVDFYKIDLHNVFRLFRQISDVNLIVDKGVSGTLTLALKDVPWDFALDIILNLSDLKKEEKYNTIVIYPAKKEFEWPKRATDNLSFEANIEVVQQEALIIEQSANQPKEILEAKDLMRQARDEERNNDYEDAAKLYEKAAKLWPDNEKLTTRLAALYLVRLGMNSKGVFYAQKSLEKDPDNHKAALYAAIGMANMNKISEAVDFFDQSISGNPPMKEALASFAAFSETNGKPSAALKLYDKYHEFYGESVNTMVAKARIYDRLGMADKANEQYKSILASGFQLQVGLKKYIESRLSGAQ